MRLWPIAFVVASMIPALEGSARAQTEFRADLNGAQETPPVSTNAGGYARFTLNSNDTVTYEVRTWLVTGTAAHIHTGAAGVAGPILFTLTGGPSVWSGTTTALSGADKANLRSFGLYVNVHSSAFSGGEVRGQIAPASALYGTRLSGDQETPPNASTAVGSAVLTVNSDDSITYSVTTTGLTATAAHIHTGAFGIAGPILFTLSGGPTSWSGTTAAMSVGDFNRLQTNGLYVNVHTGAFSGGEIRGQIVPTEVPYGFGTASSAGVPTLHGNGEAIRDGTLGLTLTGGLPSGTGLLIFSLTDGLGLLKKTVPYLIGAPLLIVALPLDAGGGFALSDTLPDLSAPIDVYFQYFGFEPGGPNGDLYASNGVLVPIFDY